MRKTLLSRCRRTLRALGSGITAVWLALGHAVQG